MFLSQRIPSAAVIWFAVSLLASPATADDLDTYEKASGDPAISACTRVIENSGTSVGTRAVAYNDRCFEYWDKGDNDRAIADCSEAIKLDPNYVHAYNNRGSAYDEKGDYDRAIADYNAAIRLDPNFANAYYNRSFAKLSKGDAAGSDADYAKAKQLDPDIDKV